MALICPNCAASYPAGNNFCQQCGCNLEMEYVANPVCPVCRTTYSAAHLFCIHDGARLVKPEDVANRCQVCNTEYPEGIRFCPMDGAPVHAAHSRRSAQTAVPADAPTTAPAGVYAQSSYTPPPPPPPPVNPYAAPAYGPAPVDKTYPKASMGRRLVAMLIDRTIALLLCIPALGFMAEGIKMFLYYHSVDAFTGLPNFGLGLLLLLVPTVFLWIKDGLGDGQSPGKKAMDLMVVQLHDHQPCTKSSSFVRALVSSLVTCIPWVGWLVEPIVAAVAEDGRTIGDRAARTQVIHTVDY